MNETKKRGSGLTILLTALITFVLTLAIAAGAAAVALGQNGIAVVHGWLLARWAFVEEDVDQQAVSDGALKGMVEALGDRWSYYVDADSYLALKEKRANQYVGIGVTINYADERGLNILAVTANSPAEAAGLQMGEIITSVEGVSAAGEGAQTAGDLIPGKIGEQRTLTVLGLDGTEREVVLTLDAIYVEVAKGELLDNGIGLVTLVNFNTNSAAAFRKAVDELVAQGATALVFDVRSNGGGYVSQLVEILDYLLPEGVIFQHDFRWGKLDLSESDANCIDLPFAVLVDADSYSAAELFAAELREMVGAYIVGEVTSGKGYSQSTVALLNGGAMGISTAAYFTGNGVSLIGTGLTPDTLISLTEEQYILYRSGKLEHGDDPQLQEAIRLLNIELRQGA